jgi:two-component system chemotaxis response regulator CheY
MPTPINLHDLVFLVADSNPYLSKLIDGMLRAFGANKIVAVHSYEKATATLAEEKVDILLCDAGLRDENISGSRRVLRDGGLTLTRNLRRNAENQNRTIPILLMAREAHESIVKKGRDAGANMVVAKPLSPKALYDRLTWIAFNARNFVDAPNYFGPDRRFKIEGYPDGVGRRKEDQGIEVSEQVGDALSQNDIDNLFNVARKG